MDIFDNIIKMYERGVTINIYVTPNAEKSKFPACFNKWRKRIEVKVCGKTKDNQANLEVVKIIADFFKKSINNVYIISGKKTKKKIVFIEDISKNTTIQMLKESLNGL